MDPEILIVVASLCATDLKNVFYLDRSYQVDTYNDPFIKKRPRSIRYAMHQPERELRYVSADGSKVYKIRIKVSDDIANKGLAIPAAPTDRACVPVI